MGEGRRDRAGAGGLEGHATLYSVQALYRFSPWSDVACA